MDSKKEIWTIETMREKLKNGIISFSFEKSDGSYRSALGTMVPDMLPDRLAEHKNRLLQLVSSVEEMSNESLEKELRAIHEAMSAPREAKTRKVNERMVSFYDLQKRAFRSFNFDSLISVITVWEVETK